MENTKNVPEAEVQGTVEEKTTEVNTEAEAQAFHEEKTDVVNTEAEVQGTVEEKTTEVNTEAEAQAFHEEKTEAGNTEVGEILSKPKKTDKILEKINVAKNKIPFLQKVEFTKKTLIIIGAVFLALVLVITFSIFHKTEFEKAREEALHIAGEIGGGSKDYFTIDTYPDSYEKMDKTLKSVLLPKTQQKALEAIKKTNITLGFPGQLYDDMMQTTALMGRCSESNDKYTVTWSYHPDDGLEVTYAKKK